MVPARQPRYGPMLAIDWDALGFAEPAFCAFEDITERIGDREEVTLTMFLPDVELPIILRYYSDQIPFYAIEDDWTIVVDRPGHVLVSPKRVYLQNHGVKRRLQHARVPTTR